MNTTEIVWEYENYDGGDWELIKDTRIEEFYKQWLATGEETGTVYHCFGDRMTVGVRFGTMTTFCMTAHNCDPNFHNVYPIRRTHQQKEVTTVSSCLLL